MSVPPEGPASDPAVLKLRVPFRVTPKGLFLFVSMVTTGTVGPIALARYAGMATKDDVVELGQRVLTVEQTRAEYGPKFTALDARITMHEVTLKKLTDGQAATQESVDKGRAENIANIAADRVREAKRSRQVRDLVFERALDNLHRGYPIHAGLDEYLR
jgi:hypothetical protein